MISNFRTQHNHLQTTGSLPLPEYNIVVLPVVGQSSLPQRVYTAPPVTPPELPFTPCSPFGPASPRFPGVAEKSTYILNVLTVFFHDKL
jgi:hypothetical protein